MYWTDDFVKRYMPLNLSDDQLKTLVRLDLQVQLQSFEKDLHHFGLPPISDEERSSVEQFANTEAALIQEELDFHIQDLSISTENTLEKFTPEQRCIYDTVLQATKDGVGLQVFISARGGCGKTFLLNALLDAV